MARFGFVTIIFMFIFIVILSIFGCIDRVESIPKPKQIRQSSDTQLISSFSDSPHNDSQSISVVPPIGSLRKILLPALKSLVGAPIKLISRLAMEVMNFIRSHSLRELYDTKLLQKLVIQLPDQLSTYWKMLAEMESQCMSRTICDLSDYTSRRLPKWVEQIWLIYLNAFAFENSYYTVAINGITTHKCSLIYSECDADQFIARIQANITQSISNSVGPMRDVLIELVNNATTSTLSSLITLNSGDIPEPENVNPSRKLFGNRIDNGDDDNEENDQGEEENDRRRSHNLKTTTAKLPST